MKIRTYITGLRWVDHAGYDGWDGMAGCEGCAHDASNIHRIIEDEAARLNYGYPWDTVMRLDQHATHDESLSILSRLVTDSEPGDHINVYWSGHGMQIPDDDGDEDDGLDEALCAFDKPIRDDQLYKILLLAKPGVTIFWVTDTCFAGGMPRFAFSWPWTRPSLKLNRPAMSASMIHIGACREDQTAGGHPDGGEFTRALCAMWAEHGPMSYEDLHMRITERFRTSSQKPTVMTYGPMPKRFLESTAFGGVR